MIREFGSEFPNFESEPDYYFRRLITKYDNITFLRSGREALGAVAQFNKKSNSTVLMPAYACSSMVTPFTFRGWDVLYYPLDSDFAPDLEYIENIIQHNDVCSILLMNYWGIVDIDNVLKKIKDINHDIITIVDQTHSVFSSEKMSEYADYYVGSIRKWMGISDGAFLISKRLISINATIGDSSFSSTRREALDIKAKYNFSLDAELKSNFRSILGNAECNLNEDRNIFSISTRNLLKLCDMDCSLIKRARRLNYDFLVNKLHEAGIEIGYSWKNFKIEVPFSLPIIVNHRDEVQKKFAVNGVYAAVLWPVPEEASSICPIAKKMSEHMLSIPIDQRYNVFDMNQMAEIIIENIK